MDAVGAKLKRSLKRQDAELASKFLDLVVPSMRERHEREARWRAAREKMQRTLGGWRSTHVDLSG
eukprot:259165-Chlamydomonas_euryale.AAC.1